MTYDLESLPYRQGVYALILNTDKTAILLVHKKNSDVWGLPGGGVDQNENFEESLIRELDEELQTQLFETVHECTAKYKYDWPESEIEKNRIKKGRLMRGQEQTFFILLFTGVDADIKLQEEELDKFVWAQLTSISTYISYPSLLSHIKTCLAEQSLSAN